MIEQIEWSEETTKFWSQYPKGGLNGFLFKDNPPEVQEKRLAFRKKLEKRCIPSRKGNYRAYKLEKQWSNSEERIDVFLKHRHTFTDRAYWKYLGEAYSEQDKYPLPVEVTRYLFGSDRTCRNMLMTAAEKEFLKALPEVVTIYRSMSVEEYESGVYGVSWTLDLEVANFFQKNRRYWGQKKIVIKIQITKREILAVFLERQEKEVIFMNQVAQGSPLVGL